MLFFLSVRLAAAIHRILYSCMPTNILVRHLRTRPGLSRAFPAALVLVPAYLFAASLAAVLIEHGEPGWLNLVVLTCVWNAVKFAWLGVLNPIKLLAMRRVGGLGVAEST